MHHLSANKALSPNIDGSPAWEKAHILEAIGLTDV